MSILFPNNPTVGDQVSVNGKKYEWNGTTWDIVVAVGSFLNEIVEDVSPQLGGGLDLNNNDILGTGNIDIIGDISCTGQFQGDLQGDVDGNVSGDIDSNGSSSFSGTVDFSGSTISNFPYSVTQDSLGFLSVDDLSDINFNSVTLDASNGQDKVLAWDQALQAFIPVDASTSSEQVQINVKNLSGVALTKGTPVYIVGTVGATDVLEIDASDASDPAKMPAIGLLSDDLNPNAEGHVSVGGLLIHVSTDAAAISTAGGDPSEGDTLYVDAGGGLTTVKPTGSNLIQNVGKVGKVSGGNSGSIVVSCIMRTNDIPNEMVLRGDMDLNGNNIVGTGNVDVTGNVTANNFIVGTTSYTEQYIEFLGSSQFSMPLSGPYAKLSIDIIDKLKVADSANAGSGVDTLVLTTTESISTDWKFYDESTETEYSITNVTDNGGNSYTLTIPGFTFNLLDPYVIFDPSSTDSDSLQIVVDNGGQLSGISSIVNLDQITSPALNEYLYISTTGNSVVSTVVAYIDAGSGPTALYYGSHNFANADVSGISADDLSDINFNSVTLDASNGQDKVLAWDQTLQAFIPVDQSGIELTDLSIGTDAAASGDGGISYDNTTGVFTYTPPDLSSIETSSLEPVAETADATDGSDLSVTGGDASGLNSMGGDLNLNGGDGALTDGNVNIGTTQTDSVNIGASGTSVSVDGPTTFSQNVLFETGVQERFSTITGATGVVSHDCNNGHIFRHTSPSADFTANFTNLGLNNNYATTITVVIEQGATARIANAVQIGGSAQTVNWQGGIVPSGTDNGVDIISFSILDLGSSYLVLGQLVDFA